MSEPELMAFLSVVNTEQSDYRKPPIATSRHKGAKWLRSGAVPLTMTKEQNNIKSNISNNCC